MKYHWAPLVVQKIKNPPAMQEAQVQSLGQKVSLQKEMETYFIFFFPGEFHAEDPGVLQSMG